MKPVAAAGIHMDVVLALLVVVVVVAAAADAGPGPGEVVSDSGTRPLQRMTPAVHVQHVEMAWQMAFAWETFWTVVDIWTAMFVGQRLEGPEDR